MSATIKATIKTDGPELDLQKKIYEAVIESGLDLRDTLSVLGNVAAWVIGPSGAPADIAIRHFTTTEMRDARP